MAVGEFTPKGDIDVSGDLGLVWGFGLHLLDFSDPLKPCLLGSYEPAETGITDVISSGSLFFATSQRGANMVEELGALHILSYFEGQPLDDPRSDVNENGIVNTEDLLILLSDWHKVNTP